MSEPTKKQCTSCCLIKHESDFSVRETRILKNGESSIHLHGKCKQCRADTERQAKRRKSAKGELNARRVVTRYGASAHSAKLTEHDITLIRELKRSLTPAVIAEKFEVHPNTIRNILNGDPGIRGSWSHVA
jgi:hypothetical protein